MFLVRGPCDRGMQRRDKRFDDDRDSVPGDGGSYVVVSVESGQRARARHLIRLGTFPSSAGTWIDVSAC